MSRLLGRGLGVMLALAALVAAAPAHAQEPLNLLYFGNSFTQATCCGGTRSVPAVVFDLARAAGYPAPRTVNRSVNGQSLQWHIDNNASAINTGIPAGEDWDFVVLQDLSTMPTRLGSLSQHLSSTLDMYQLVADRSPDVVPVLYETWARGPGHSFYAGANPSFPGGPAEMQAELRDGYEQSTANINQAVGMDIARLARAGDAWEADDFWLGLYANDIYHANNRGVLLNGLVLYGTIYGDPTTSDIPLASVLNQLGLSAEDGARLTAVADSVLAIPEPSSGTLLLASFALAGRRRRARARRSV
ncbi:hypothetical protein [Botrimarina sp.]|uniref:hypothetical protein n=1 Tax=Botrimarina sp. TaxID=2795802 RepID=UPI0032EF63F6